MFVLFDFPQVFENVRLNKGILLYGPPRCGKTLLGKALAEEAGVPFKYVNANEFKAGTIGATEASIRRTFEQMMQTPGILFIDEFDAFYHFELSKAVVELIKSLPKTQVFVTTHNTDLLSNDLLRPDCYFEIVNNKIHAFNEMTDKDIRKAHNMQKMYKAGAFNGR